MKLLQNVVMFILYVDDTLLLDDINFFHCLTSVPDSSSTFEVTLLLLDEVTFTRQSIIHEVAEGFIRQRDKFKLFTVLLFFVFLFQLRSPVEIPSY